MKQHNANLVVHVNKSVAPDQARDLARNVITLWGVGHATMSRHANHLMLVDYDPHSVDSRGILRYIRAQGYSAQLIGM